MPKESDPSDLGLTEFVEAVRPIELIHDHVVAILLTQPVVERRLPPGGGLLQVLTKSYLRAFRREADIAVPRI
ncbi:hypothetical protein [Mycolicibacter arupensis]|uniref:hypothetical protein n=1 Tax=Mycolicibacter arupensis TaxID=342002 RepID=UPI00165FB747|nr:hypothetical protein [Mycolicibacter arupensis]